MRIDDPTNSRPESLHVDIDTDAISFLRAWLPLVRELPHLIRRQERVWDLLAWYEHVVEHEDYEADPPVEGLDALIDELAVPCVPYDVHAELARARWAIRVAEELVRWRHFLHSAGPDSPHTTLAIDRLDLATQEARGQIEASA